MARSASWVTGVVTVEVLLVKLGSGWLPLIVAVLVRVPVTDEATSTSTVVVAVPPLAMLPSVTVRVSLAKLVVPWLVVAETKVSPAGSVSVTVTPVALDGPLFVEVNV